MAPEFSLSPRTVKRLYKRFEKYGESGIEPDYAQCGGKQPLRAPEKLIAQAERLRREHPTWGAELIRIHLKGDASRTKLPATRTLQRWFQKHGLTTAPPGRRPQPNPARATRPHEVWQMDGAERMCLQSRQQVSWLRVVDEFSGAVLDTTVFGQAFFSSVPPTAVQKALRAAFSTWGRPQRFRVDNGSPWGSVGEFPTELALWLLGLDIDIEWNPPRQPQKNGVVERSQGVGKNWAEPHGCRNIKELQQRLRKMDRIQREEYPSVKGQSRLAAYPELRGSGRRYDRKWEAKQWNFSRVLDLLSEYVVTRRVDHGGSVSIYNRPYYVGKHHRGKTIHVYLDPLAVQWVFATSEGEQLRTHPALEITAERIIGMDVTHRRPKPK